MVKVYILSGDFRVTLDHPVFPKKTNELVELFKEALDDDELNAVSLGKLTCFSPTPKGYSQKALFIETESLIRKAGFEIRKREEA